MSAPLTVLPAVVSGGVGAYYAHSQHDDLEKTVAIAGGAAAASLGLGLIVEEQSYYVSSLLVRLSPT